MRKRIGVFLAAFVILVPIQAVKGQTSQDLSNALLRAEFSGGHLRTLVDLQTGFRLDFAEEAFSLIVDDQKIESHGLIPGEFQSDKERLTFIFQHRQFKIRIDYELRTGWRFLSKQITLEPAASGSYRVNEIEALVECL